MNTIIPRASLFSCVAAPLVRLFVLGCLGALLFVSIPSTHGFSLNGYRWPAGSQVNISLQLARSPVPLQDGSASWNASAAEALAVWNQHVDAATLVEGPASTPAAQDGVNSVSFSNTMYGETFPPGVLAVTLYYSQDGQVFNETDVIFNNSVKWDSYKGQIQGWGPTATYDLHRVALHEFGHVIGLAHPDQNGQSVSALMNSVIQDLDHLTEDDIAGARALYGLKLTSSLNPPSGRSGDDFAYQVMANNNPTSFSATGLPPGFQIDAASGLISGRCPTSGTFQVDVAVQGAFGTATGRVRVVITPLPLASTSFGQIQIGDSFSYQILARNNPTSYAATGLPAGLQIDTATGVISGIPEASGSFSIRVIARSAVSEAAGDVTLLVHPPRITSPSPPAVELGDPFSYQITATNNPTSFSVSGLPAELQFDPSTGLISGTRNSAGTFFVNVTAHTAFGNPTSVIGFVVLQPRITSPSHAPPVDIGGNFTYQITATGRPTSFSAVGLPAGLHLDTATGLISGVPTLSGTYTITITAHGVFGPLSTSLSLVVNKLALVETPAARFTTPTIYSLIADPNRPRVYAAVSSGILVIDTNSMSLLKTIQLPNLPFDISVSPDGSTLWIANSSQFLQRIDLESLTVMANLRVAEPASRVREGLGGRLYISTPLGGGVAQIDAATGALQGKFNPGTGGSFPPHCVIEISPDRKVLYAGSLADVAPVLARYDISSETPALVQSVPTPEGSSQALLSVSHNGQLVSYGFGAVKRLRSTADLNVITGSFSVSGYVMGALAFAADDTLAFQSLHSGSFAEQNKIAVFDTGTSQLVRTLTLGGYSVSARMVVDNANSHLFVSSGSNFLVSQSEVLAFPVHPPRSTLIPAPKSLLNVSTRLRSQGGENVLIGGFIISGQEPKKLALRAIGPSLPLTGKLTDPVLELHDATPALIGENDNWNAHRAAVLATGIPPANEREAVLLATLQPGSYTVVVRGLNDLSGVALVEAYDLTSDSNSKLANISTRGKVETDDNVMIGGFIIGGNEETAVAVRAIGPSLTNHGIAGALADPTLAVHDSNGALLEQNDDWRATQEQALINSGLAPSENRESAMLLSLGPGAYTAIVRGKDNGIGVGLVEVYNLDAN